MGTGYSAVRGSARPGMGLRAWGWSLAVALLMSACAVDRRAPSAGDLAEMKRARLGYLASYHEAVTERVTRRMEYESGRSRAGERATFDILVISGGGDYGAFGAGFLQGWGWPSGDTSGPRLDRPEFDMVTGVSTGALIAPFAFAGTEQDYGRIAALYASPKQAWFVSRGLLRFVFGAPSYLETDGLRRELESQVDAEIIAAVGEGERSGRTLWIGATDLDLGVLYPWDLTLEARRIADAWALGGVEGESGARASRFHDVLMASAAIPAVFPPVEIDGTLYVDGGTTSNILYDADLLREGGPVDRYSARNPGAEPPVFRFWVIVNNKLGAEESVVRPTWMSITKASVAAAIRSSTIGSLRHLESQAALQRCRGLDVEFRFVAIPDGWSPPTPDPEPFDPAMMRSLLDLGRALGETADPWRRHVSAAWEGSPAPAR